MINCADAIDHRNAMIQRKARPCSNLPLEPFWYSYGEPYRDCYSISGIEDQRLFYGCVKVQTNSSFCLVGRQGDFDIAHTLYRDADRHNSHTFRVHQNKNDMPIFWPPPSEGYSGVYLTMEGPAPKPIEITHKRYTNLEHGYTVTVRNVRHFQGKYGFHSIVEVQGTLFDKKRSKNWSAAAFLQAFKPKGRKLRIKTRYERLMGRDLL